MSRKNILIITISIIVIILFIFTFLFFNKDEDGNTSESSEDIFSFDSSGNRVDSGEANQNVFGPQEVGVSGELTTSGSVPSLRKISFKEVSGFGLFDEEGTTTIRYIEREFGNVIEASSKSLKTKRITNTTLPRTIDSLWIDKNNVVLRYLDDNNDIQTFSTEIVVEEDGLEGFAKFEGLFLEENIEEIDILGEKIFILIKNLDGSVGITSSPDLKTQNRVLSTPLKEILASWVDNNTVAVNTKPSSKSLGHLFFLNTSNGFLTTVLSEITGLKSNVSGSGDIIYSASENNGVSLWLFNQKSGESTEVQKATFAEKCVWANTEDLVVYCAVPKKISFTNLPDEWYMGNIFFSDEIWRIDLDTNEMEKIIDLEKVSGERIDVLEIKINSDDDYLAFTNKVDMTLWGITLSEN